MNLKVRAGVAIALLLLTAWMTFAVITKLMEYPILGSLLGVTITAVMLARMSPPINISEEGLAWILYIAIAAASWTLWPLAVSLGVLMVGIHISFLVVYGPSFIQPKRSQPRQQAIRPKSLEDLLSELKEAWERGENGRKSP